MCVLGSSARTHTPPLKTHTACHTHAMGLRSPSCLLLLLVLVPATTAASTCTGTDPCTLDCTDCSAYEKAPDPENCRGYYVCDGTGGTLSSLPLQCPDGQVYNITVRDCTDGDSCDECPPPCSYECSISVPYAAYPFSCNAYYTCDLGGGISGIEQCPGSAGQGLFFDGTSCQADETRCCYCLPYCYTTDFNSLIADPQDCRKYYFCGSTPGVSTQYGMCPTGENFDSDNEVCSALVPCSTKAACRNVVGADGCIDPFTCQQTGYFAKCPNQCTPDYYHCTAATGDFQDVISCSGDEVFHPDNHICVNADQCL
ncbi:latent-transforming growth factor beta-binding protein 4-like [Eriocheir sinensis]|uniref:latent-transforming growth factor beta-binding protein 4-like n=1 Tax=Eriocheir sinensis TaxID=95602 RepID=UPI0021C8E7F9|nr:latent-transforming growth factor beta-binding protein 4-like [Eriocheir sinensis]